VVAGAAALVLALVGGVTYAMGALSGGGQQAAEALPGGAIGLLSVDLDPPAGQKIDGFRFLRKFPTLREHVPLDGDAREVVFDAFADELGWSDVDFDADVSPWLGKRLAVAVYPPTGGDGSDPVVVVALQVTDADKADAGLEKLAAQVRTGTDGPAPAGWAFSGDYALVAENAMSAKDLATRAGTAPLSTDEHFAADTESADDGVVLAWADLGRAAGVLGGAAAVPQVFGGSAGGRTTMVARFDGPDVVELSGTTTGLDGAGWAEHQVHGMGDLPASTAVAFGLADGDQLAAKAWTAAQGFLGIMSAEGGDDRSLEDELGLTMPDDLATLLGSNLLIALDGGGSDELQVGARITTDAAAATKVLDALETQSDDWLAPEFTLVRRTVGDDLVVADTKEQADRLASDGALGDDETFRSALPDLDDAALALWVDPAGVQTAFGLGTEPDPDLEPLDGVGLTVSSISDGTASFRFRMVAH
jgi:hypothetical protein